MPIDGVIVIPDKKVKKTKVDKIVTKKVVSKAKKVDVINNDNDEENYYNDLNLNVDDKPADNDSDEIYDDMEYFNNDYDNMDSAD